MPNIVAGLCSELQKKLRKHFLKQSRLFLELLLFVLIFHNHQSHLCVAQPSTHARAPCQMSVFRAQCGIYKYINIYIMSVRVRKKAYSLCLVFWGNYKTGNILYDENPNEEKQDI